MRMTLDRKGLLACALSTFVLHAACGSSSSGSDAKTDGGARTDSLGRDVPVSDVGTSEATMADAAALDALAADSAAASEAGGAVEAGSAEGGGSPDATTTSPDVASADRATDARDSADSSDVAGSVDDTAEAGGVGSDVGTTGGAGGTGGVPGSGGASGGAGAGGAGPAQLALVMIANPDPAVPLGLIDYEIRVSNTGTGTITNVVLTEQTLNGANAIVSTISAGGACSNTAACAPGVIITWPAFSLAPGQVQIISFTSQVLNGTANGTNVHNTATLTFPGGTLMQSRDVLVDASQSLSVRLAPDHDPVVPGDTTTYTVMVGNSGTQSFPLSAAGVLAATIPTGTTFVSATGGGTVSGSTVQWSLGSIDAGATGRYTYTVTVGSGLGDGTVLEATSQILDGTASLARAAANTTVNAAAALKLTLIANPDPAAPLGLVNYKIRLSNTGDSTLTNVVLKEATQNNANTIVSEISGGGGCSNTAACGPGVVITWPAFTLAPGQTQTILFTNQIASGTADGTLVHNTVSVAYSGGAVTQSMDLAVSSAQGLRLAIDEDHDPVSPGDSITYAVVVGNAGSRSLPLSSAGVLAATIPPGTTFVSGSAGATFSNGLVKWSIGSVDAGANQHYTYTVTVGSGLHGGSVLPALAQVMDGDASVVRAATATVVDATSALRLTMVANPDPAASLGLVVYKVKVRNTSGSTLTNIVVREATQNSASTIVSTITGGGACSNTASCGPGVVITWPALTLAPGQSQTILFTNQVASGTVDGTLIHSTATVTYSGGSVSQGLALAVNSSAGLRLAIAEDHDPVSPNDTLTYTIVAGNTGSQSLPLSATGILTATVPQGATFVSASAGGTASGGIVQWNVGAVDAGASGRYTYTVALAGTLGDGAVLQSTARILDGSQSLVRAVAATEVKGASPIKVVMTANPDPAAPLALVDYEVKVSNTSTSSLTNVVLTESTQNSANTIVATIVGGGACSNTAACGPGVIVTWPALTLAPGQTQTLSFTNQVANGTLNGTLIHNAATVTYPGGSISQGIDLVVSNTQALRLAIGADHDPVAPGDAITYTVVTGNPGSQSLPLSAAGILTATVPQGTTFASATDGGTLDGGLVRWSVGAIDAGASKHYTYTVTAGTTLGDGASLLAFAQILDGATSLVRSAASTDVKAASPLTLTMTVSPDPAAPLGLVNYVLVATNTGTSSLTNLVMRDAIQNSASIIVADITGGGSCSNTAACSPGVIVTWPAFTLTAGQAQTLSFTAQVANGTLDGTLIHNGATLTYPSGTVSQGYDLVVHH